MKRTLADKYYEGHKDGYENKPKAKGLKGDNKKVYESGYAEGTKDRSLDGARRKNPSFDFRNN